MTEQEINELVEAWHLAEPGDAAYQYDFGPWMMLNTGWSQFEFEEWARTGFYDGEGTFG